jgi:hypothetical protein
VLILAPVPAPERERIGARPRAFSAARSLRYKELSAARFPLVVLGVAALAGKTKIFGRASRYVETVSYSATFLFHLIPGITETTTRLPLGAPLLPGPEAPQLQVASGVLFLFFLIGAVLQVRRLRAHPAG